MTARAGPRPARAARSAASRAASSGPRVTRRRRPRPQDIERGQRPGGRGAALGSRCRSAARPGGGAGQRARRVGERAVAGRGRRAGSARAPRARRRGSRSVGAAEPLLARGGVEVAAERAQSTGTAPRPCAPSSSSWTPVGRERRQRRRAAGVPGHVREGHEACGPAEPRRQLGERHQADRDPARARERGQRGEQAGCSSSLVSTSSPAPRSSASEHEVHAVGRGAGERQLGGVGAEQRRPPAAQLARCARAAPRSEPGSPRPLGLARDQLGRARRTRARRNRPVGAGVQVGEPLEHRELGAKVVMAR